MHERGGAAARRDDEGFDAKPADKIGNADASLVSREIALIPGQAKGRIRQLKNEGIELCLR